MLFRSRDSAGRIHISLTNLDPDHSRTVHTELRGANVYMVSGRILTAPTMNAHNTFEQPNAVHLASFSGASLAGDRLTVELPAKSVVVLELR